MYLHPKHGLNPTMTTCYYCNEPASILLVGNRTKKFREAGMAKKDGEMNMNIGVIDARPCSKCEGYMKRGVILISIRDSAEKEMENAEKEKRLPNPYRTGGWIVVRDEFIRRVINPAKLANQILKQRFCFVPDAVWKALGLPRGAGKQLER